ncbi:MAG: HEAT repeat domain-containing protein, partial [Planctomycetaceae bacterium]
LSVATAKSGNKSQILSLLLLAMPAPDSPRQHWQAVVIGGGLINGVTQSGLWPHELFAASQFNTPETLNRWNRTLQLAKTMALDMQVPAGTRYDALRILALLPTEQALSSLLPQLKPNTHPELQMGAISALGDIPAPEAAAELVNHLPGFTAENQQLAITALTRTPERCLLLLKALENNSIPANILSLNDAHSLQQHPDENVRKAAVHVLAKDKN